MSDYKRFKTSTVDIGGIPIGGQFPVRIQSMLNTNTLDTEACLKQSIELIEAGCEYIRITAPGTKEAENLRIITEKLRAAGYQTPIIADVHFNPRIAEYCAHFVAKVRINPGNYADKKSFKKITYTHQEYTEELERIAERITPLLKICRTEGSALRIGTNHGSLSDRIMNRYGDTPEGMVEATMEFLRICAAGSFNNIVVSLKASNPIIMANANRLLVSAMKKENLCFPLHLGVTEAGAGEDGRIKSALGIGTLLSEGIGDTIRVSLTENPVKEVPFAILLKEKYAQSDLRTLSKSIDTTPNLWKNTGYYTGKSNNNLFVKRPSIILKTQDSSEYADLFSFNPNNQLYERHFSSPDALHSNNSETNILSKSIPVLTDSDVFQIKASEPINLTSAKAQEACVLVCNSIDINILQTIKEHKESQSIKTPLFVNIEQDQELSDAWLVENTVNYGSILLQNLIDGFYINTTAALAPSLCRRLFDIMQACRVRISKTEYISCPTCGRTSFNIEKTLSDIKEATGHLSGLKIAVMGCVVNGPGEMADADYGYVGNALGKVNLYKGKLALKKNILQEDAINQLIKLLKEDGLWLEK